MWVLSSLLSFRDTPLPYSICLRSPAFDESLPPPHLVRGFVFALATVTR